MVGVVGLYHLSKIQELERTLSERLALKVAEFSEDAPNGCLSAKLSKKLLNTKAVNELNNLRDILITVREARDSGLKYCDAYQARSSEEVTNLIDKYSRKLDKYPPIIEPNFFGGILIDIISRYYKPDFFSTLGKAFKDEKRMAENI